MSADKIQTEEEQGDTLVESATTQELLETIRKLQGDVENLRLELRKTRAPSGRIGIILTIPGVLSLVFSILISADLINVDSSLAQILAFIGLGLTFWGVLLFFSRPVRYVKSSLLDSILVSSYSTIDRMVKDLNYGGKGYYIPPLPEKSRLPDYLKGLKDMIVFISAKSNTHMPSIEEISKGMFLLKNPNGAWVVPPGLGLLTQFEKEAEVDITRLELSELCDRLPKVITENFQLAKEVEMEPKEDQVHLRILDSIYKNLYSPESNLKSVHLLGCPLVSAIACAIAKTTGKIVKIEENRVSSDLERIEVTCRFINV